MKSSKGQRKRLSDISNLKEQPTLQKRDTKTQPGLLMTYEYVDKLQKVILMCSISCPVWLANIIDDVLIFLSRKIWHSWKLSRKESILFDRLYLSITSNSNFFFWAFFFFLINEVFPWWVFSNSRIIEISGNELEKLRTNFQKLQQQNMQLAQANCQMLAVILNLLFSVFSFYCITCSWETNNLENKFNTWNAFFFFFLFSGTEFK